MTSRITASLVTVAVVSLGAGVSAQEAPPGFRLHGRFVGIGGCLNTLVGAGPEAGAERLYASHIYGGDVLDIVAIDPATGKAEAFASPVLGEVGAWAMALGADGQLYVGTLPKAHVLRLDWRQRTLVDLGRPSETEQYIWQLALATDGKLYGCTYPNAKLVRFDSATGQSEDLGRMDPTEQYARTVAADDKGFVYVGIGTVHSHLVAYEIASGQHRDILPAESAAPGFGGVTRGADGVVYGTAGGKHFRLDGWTALPLAPAEVKGPAPLALADGRTVAYDGKSITLTDPGTKQTTARTTDYRGKSQSLFRIGLGPDDRLYGSTAMPIHFLWADPDSDRWEELGQPGGGEFYSFLAWKELLIGAAYGGNAPLMIYRPGQPWAPEAKPSGNPWLIHYAGENGGWRPMAMIAGKDEKVYIGAVSGYGLLGGPLCVFDPATGAVDQHLHLVRDQSVVALALLADGRLVGGTTVGGGGGSQPTQTEAKLFLWDPVTRETLFETVPVPGAGTITSLACGSDGLVYGFAGNTLFVFDPGEQKVIDTVVHDLGSVVYNAVFPGPDDRLLGLSSKGIFDLDPATRRPRLLAAYPGRIEGGWALRGRTIYFTSGPQILSWTLPH
jgi:outer membrane protein assembly factor BamB